MKMKPGDGSATLDAAGDAPESTDGFFRRAKITEGAKVIRRGRPRQSEPKRLVAIRFPSQVLARLRARER